VIVFCLKLPFFVQTLLSKRVARHFPSTVLALTRTVLALTRTHPRGCLDRSRFASKLDYIAVVIESCEPLSPSSSKKLEILKRTWELVSDNTKCHCRNEVNKEVDQLSTANVANSFRGTLCTCHDHRKGAGAFWPPGFKNFVFSYQRFSRKIFFSWFRVVELNFTIVAPPPLRRPKDLQWKYSLEKTEDFSRRGTRRSLRAPVLEITLKCENVDRECILCQKPRLKLIKFIYPRVRL